MKMAKYIPVNCELVDHIEIHATKRKFVWLNYWSYNRSSIIQEKVRLKSWTTENGEEFLILEDDRRIRLDFIRSLDRFEVGDAHCKI